VHRALLAVISPDNTPHGYNLTFAFPMALFVIVALALFLIFRSTHRVPGHVAMSSSRWARKAPAEAATAAPAAVASEEAHDEAAQTGQAEHTDESTEGGE
jgi:hypothetical protein